MTDVELNKALEDWKHATGKLPWGVQTLCHDTLVLAANEKVNLVYGADYKDGQPCLFNAIRNMTSQLESTPSSFAGAVVYSFDRVNSILLGLNVNTSVNRVSPMAAEILVHYFGTMKSVTQNDIEAHAMALASFTANCTPYIELTDTEIMTDWLVTISNEATRENTIDAAFLPPR